MSIFEAMLLGLVQGLCEFLPVSSSGHLLLLSKVLGITEGTMFFSVMLHLATLAAVLVSFWPLVKKLIRRPFSKPVFLLVVAILPTVAVAILFKKVEPFASFYAQVEEGRFLGWCFLITSLLLVISDQVKWPADRQRKLKNMRYTDALCVGLMQGVGVLPGVSRSGSTISGALFAGLDRKAAADFSFLLSIPSILGGAVLEIPDALEQGIGGIHWTALFFGMLVAGFVGFFAIRLMLAAIKKKKLWGFALYTALLGIAVLFDQFVTHLYF